MQVQQNRMRITTDDGVATVWIGGGAEFHFDDLCEFARQLVDLQKIPALDLIVVRADSDPQTPSIWQARPVLIQPDDSAALRFARRGTEFLNALRNSVVPTLAFIEGACTGLGLELALACDERFGVSGATATYGFGSAPTPWGGKKRARELFGQRTSNVLSKSQITARQARQARVLDRVCCQRRAKIDLQSWIDYRRQFPIKKRGLRWWVPSLDRQQVAEREVFRRAALAGVYDPLPAIVESINPYQPVSNVALVGEYPHWPILAREWCLSGVNVQCVGFELPAMTAAMQSGRVTPLEASQANERLWIVPDAVALQPANLVFLDEQSASMAVMLERDLAARTLLVLPESFARRLCDFAVHPQRVVGFHWQSDGYELSGNDSTTQQLSIWLEQLGVPHTVCTRDTDLYGLVDATPLDIGYDGATATRPIGASRATPTRLHTD